MLIINFKGFSMAFREYDDWEQLFKLTSYLNFIKKRYTNGHDGYVLIRKRNGVHVVSSHLYIF